MLELYEAQFNIALAQSHSVYDSASVRFANDAFLESAGSRGAAFIMPWGCPAGDQGVGL